MRNVTTLSFKVRSYELGHDGSMLHGSIMNWLEEGAVQASNRAGYPEAWFEENGYLWLIRKWMVCYLQPICLDDQLTLQTWISDFRRVQSHREYVLSRGDEVVVRARANWVFIHRETLRPARLLTEFEDNYGPIPHEALEPISTELISPTAVEGRPFQFAYGVRYHEIDRAKHVNNAHYIRWVEDSMVQTLQKCGVGLGDISIQCHEMEYHHSAQFGDSVLVQSQLMGFDADRMRWQHRLSHPNSDHTVALGRSLVQVQNRPMSDVINHLAID